MTQDQYGQARGAGYGDGVEDETDAYSAEGSKPMTRFQKVASALRGDRPDRDEADEEAGQEVTDPGLTASSATAVDSGPAAGADVMAGPDAAGSDAARSDVMADPDMAAGTDIAAESDVRPDGQGGQASSPWATGSRQDDYWEVPDGREDHVAAVTSPDGPAASTDGPVTDPDLPVTEATADPLARQDETHPGFTDGPYPASTDPASTGPASTDPASTDPDMYGTSPAGRDAFPGDAVSEHPATGATVTGATVTGATVAGDTGAGDTGAGDRVGAAGTEAPEGRHAAAPEEQHPGEAAGTLDDLGDLAYGKLIPDAADFTAQWQQIQFRFVDDPQASVTEAAEVVAQVTAKLEAAIQERQRAIQARQQAIQERQRSLAGRWGEGTQADTETLRETLRMYRAFLDQLIGPKA